MKYIEFFLFGIDVKVRFVGLILYWIFGLGGEVVVGLFFGGEDGIFVVFFFWGDFISGIKIFVRFVKF